MLYQSNSSDCGPACLHMIANYYNKLYDESIINSICNPGPGGSSLEDISKAAEYLGFKTLSVKMESGKLNDELLLPCIAYWKKTHFVVIHKISRNKVYFADPSMGLRKFSKVEFISNWLVEQNRGVLLMLEPAENDQLKTNRKELRSRKAVLLLTYLKAYKFLFFQLGLGLLAGSLIQLIFPILTQSLVDVGIGSRDMGFIYMILLGQLLIFLGQSTVNLIKSWILLHIGARINMKIVYDFLYKLMRLSINFFETNKTGNLFQRIFDSKRIENFITNSLITTLFSVVNLLVLALVLAIYSMKIFLVFSAGTIISSIWLALFLKRRREIDNLYFSAYSENYNKIFQLIFGIRDIKLNSAETNKLNKWEEVQSRLFKVQMKGQANIQYQHTGAIFFTQLKNIIITFIAAQSVVSGDMTLGMMMAVTFIIGQMNVPVEQLISFIQSGQDAGISTERLFEIMNQKEEGDLDSKPFELTAGGIQVCNLNFKYSPEDLSCVLKNVNLQIERGKITAIVGSSGSGKTTLLKLLLKFYNPEKGSIVYGDMDLKEVAPMELRKKCGVVLQDSFLFSDTIAANIALCSEEFNSEKLDYAARVANIYDFIQSSPYKYFTKIGSEEKGVSQGQKQRILIARAVYRDPEFLFLDEATNALDTENESVVMNNLLQFFTGKTVVIVAHRLSTVVNADKIVVLEKGEIAESGNHSELVNNRGNYFNLIKNQLELNRKS